MQGIIFTSRVSLQQRSWNLPKLCFVTKPFLGLHGSNFNLPARFAYRDSFSSLFLCRPMSKSLCRILRQLARRWYYGKYYEGTMEVLWNLQQLLKCPQVIFTKQSNYHLVKKIFPEVSWRTTLSSAAHCVVLRKLNPWLSASLRVCIRDGAKTSPEESWRKY